MEAGLVAATRVADLTDAVDVAASPAADIARTRREFLGWAEPGELNREPVAAATLAFAALQAVG
ncbi:hypothetical protein [Streptomyces sp. NPDC001985]|uniref:hypothetical protein n=1 Tax=Streptomyces sp. NPDC001985 TaxID=3154406 RepID=UPI003319B9E4